MHGSYLQGMETEDGGESELSSLIRTDPTYKEWKLLEARKVVASFYAARILPTRNGNYVQQKMKLRQPLQGTDPTYKEWKPNISTPKPSNYTPHGSYLQGMET